MSAVFKRLERRDAFISPYTAHKTFTFTSSSFGEVGIELKRGVSGSFPYNEEALTYAGTKHIMFDTYGQMSSEFNWTSSLGTEVNVLSISRNLYGHSIKPGSFLLEISGSETVTDSNGYILSGSTQVGIISYSKGLVTLTAGGYEEEDTFSSSSFVTVTDLHIQKVYAALTHSISLDPTSDPNPFQPGASDPTEMIIFQSSSHDFSGEYIYGTPDATAVFPTAPYLAPRLTLTIGAVSASYFAQLIDDTTTGQLTLDFNQNLAHPITGPVNLSNDVDYGQFDSIEIEWKKDARSEDEVTHVFLASGSWSSSLYDYPQSSSNFTIIDEYRAEVDPVNLTSIGTYPADLTDVEEVRVEFTSASNDYSYFGGNYTASFQATEPILTHTYHCHIDPNEFGLSYNPSLQDTTKVSGSLVGFATGSNFRPYATAVGLYNSVGELIAVGKLSEPTPILKETHYTFVVKIDL
jgi:hypothetical protein